MTTTISNNTNIGSIQLNTVSSTVDIAETWSINESAIMYMRPKTIEFKAEGLKPNTQYYPFFNNVDISNFCSMENGKTSSLLFSDSIGTVLGNFYLPSASFTCGSHTFKLVDAVATISSTTGESMYVPDPQYGSAEAIYEASGILKQQQKTITTLTVIDAPQTPPLPPIVVPPVPNPKPVPEPLPPVIIHPVPKPPEPVLPPIVISPIYSPIIDNQNKFTMGAGCFLWYYNYTITKNVIQKDYTVTSMDSNPPSTTSIESIGVTGISGGGGKLDPSAYAKQPKVTYVQSIKLNNTQWNHVYSITVPVVKTYKRSVRGSSSIIPPILWNIAVKPSGLESTDFYAPYIPPGATTPWVYGGMVTANCDKQIQRDPLAQSFFIEPAQFPSGIFATSITVYFKKVDQSCPVMLELRNMINGSPGSTILPGGMVIIPGYSVMQSDNASIPTVFTFDHPIYLAPKMEYCFVLKSTSLGYDVWCSRFGEIDKITGKVIDEQPTTGVLFKSSNDSTWTPTQYEDIKYDLNIAEFDITVSSLVKLKPQLYSNDSVSFYYDTKQTLPLSFIHTTSGSTSVRINIPLHGLINNDTIYFGDFPNINLNGLSYTEFENKTFNIEYVDEDNIDIVVLNAASKTGPILITDAPQIIDNRPPITNVTTAPPIAIPFINDDNTLAISPQTPDVLNSPVPPKAITSSSFEVYTNIIINEIMLDYVGTEFSNTAIDELLYVEQGNSTASITTVQPGITETININNNKFFVELEKPALLLSKHNENAYTNNGLLELILRSSDKYLSPIIDLNGLSLITKTYKIDNQNSEITDIFGDTTLDGYDTLSDKYKDQLNDPTINSEIISGTGNANAKYKSRLIKLDPSTTNKRISIFVVGTCPEPAEFDVYLRLSNDEFTHIDHNWMWVPLENPKSSSIDYTMKFNPSVTASTMTEWNYEYVHTESFNTADIKIVMRSTNNSVTPKIYSIRAITNAT